MKGPPSRRRRTIPSSGGTGAWALLSKLIAQVAGSCVAKIIRDHLDSSTWFN